MGPLGSAVLVDEPVLVVVSEAVLCAVLPGKVELNVMSPICVAGGDDAADKKVASTVLTSLSRLV